MILNLRVAMIRKPVNGLDIPAEVPCNMPKKSSSKKCGEAR